MAYSSVNINDEFILLEDGFNWNFWRYEFVEEILVIGNITPLIFGVSPGDYAPVFLASSMNISQHLGIIFNFIRNLISIGPKVMKESGCSFILFPRIVAIVGTLQRMLPHGMVNTNTRRIFWRWRSTFRQITTSMPHRTKW